MHLEDTRAYCLQKKGVTEGFPFDGETLVFKVMGKMFALMALERKPPQINLKCDPDRALELREAYAGHILPGYHMSKVHWNTVHLESIPPQTVRELIDHSYALVTAKLTKKMRTELEAMS
jgi:predicted DNA-binding protein (MmcQ/YjbR family)